MTLTEFLLARIDEDERLLHWRAQDASCIGFKALQEANAIRKGLVECEAKRQIVELAYGECRDDVAKAIIRALALPYADHPDYQQEWANA